MFRLFSYVETPATTALSNSRESVEIQQLATLTGEYSVIQRQPEQQIDITGQHPEQERDPSELVQQEPLELDTSGPVQQDTKLERDPSELAKHEPEQERECIGLVQQENTEVSEEHQESRFSIEPSSPPPPVPSHSPIKAAVKVRHCIYLQNG